MRHTIAPRCWNEPQKHPTQADGKGKCTVVHRAGAPPCFSGLGPAHAVGRRHRSADPLASPLHPPPSLYTIHNEKSTNLPKADPYSSNWSPSSSIFVCHLAGDDRTETPV
uniref:Uncharacterized protein n=1 Tax=Arundo donax TaxID=35708 RepID=A0A0A8ZFC2_ARUDO